MSSIKQHYLKATPRHREAVYAWTYVDSEGVEQVAPFYMTEEEVKHYEDEHGIVFTARAPMEEDDE